jgi:hypothetical protein
MELLMLDRLGKHWLLIGILVAVASPLAAQRPNARSLVGTWVMDTTKFDKHDPELVALTLNVSQHGDTLLIVTNGKDVAGPPFTMTNQFVPESSSGAASVDTVPHLGRVAWAGDTMVVHIVERRPQRTLEIEERWVMQNDGQTLSRFQSVRDGQRLSRQTLLFSRVAQ